MVEKIKKLIVCLFDKEVGTLTEANGRLSFQYNENAEHPISVSMPIRQEAYNNNDTQKFFANLLPEGNPREKIAKFYNIKESLFPMLKEIGGECAGAISLYPETNHNIEVDKNQEAELFTRKEFNKHINSLPNRPLSIGNRIRLSLAGAQAKTAMLIKEEDFVKLYSNAVPYKFEIYGSDDIDIYRPSATEFSTHIVKPKIKGLRDTVYNELFCMLLAYNLFDGKDNLVIPRVTLYRDNDTECLFVQRYDRYFYSNINEPKDRFERLHQEDFCQVLSIYPEKKYQEDGGVSIKQCFGIVNQHITFKSESIDRMLNIIIFNYLIGNCDAHGKNFSIIHNSMLIPSMDSNLFGRFYHDLYGDVISLAPFYDLMSTEIYNSVDELGDTQKMAMSIGGEYDPKKITLAHFDRMVKELNIKPVYIRDKIKKMSSVIVDKAKSLRKELQQNDINSEIFEQIIKLIKERVKSLEE